MYKQFNKDLRKELAVLLKAGHSSKKCGSLIGFEKRSINREIKSNKDPDGIYRAVSAHKKYLQRRKQAKVKEKKIENDKQLEKCIIKRLAKGISPEQISGRIENNLTGMKLQNVSYLTIYNWIYRERKELAKHLRIIGTKGKYRRKKGTRIREKQRDEAKIKRINTRPEIVETRGRIGDWEGDTIVGKDKTKRLLTGVERKSGYGLLDKIEETRFENIHEILRKRFKKIAKKKKSTYTYDNGKELGLEDADLEKKIKMEVYRAYPYHSWERGCNENYNGLVRQFFPKGTDFGNISEKEIKRVERIINHRPRKRLNFLTPHEVFVKNMEPDKVGRLRF